MRIYQHMHHDSFWSVQIADIHCCRSPVHGSTNSPWFDNAYSRKVTWIPVFLHEKISTRCASFTPNVRSLFPDQPIHLNRASSAHNHIAELANYLGDIVERKNWSGLFAFPSAERILDGCHFRSESFDTIKWNETLFTVYYINILSTLLKNFVVVLASWLKKKTKILCRELSMSGYGSTIPLNEQSIKLYDQYVSTWEKIPHKIHPLCAIFPEFVVPTSPHDPIFAPYSQESKPFGTALTQI